jgi:hypothetical protein
MAKVVDAAKAYGGTNLDTAFAELAPELTPKQKAHDRAKERHYSAFLDFATSMNVDKPFELNLDRFLGLVLVYKNCLIDAGVANLSIRDAHLAPLKRRYVDERDLSLYSREREKLNRGFDLILAQVRANESGRKKEAASLTRADFLRVLKDLPQGQKDFSEFNCVVALLAAFGLRASTICSLKLGSMSNFRLRDQSNTDLYELKFKMEDWKSTHSIRPTHHMLAAGYLELDENSDAWYLDVIRSLNTFLKEVHGITLHELGDIDDKKKENMLFKYKSDALASVFQTKFGYSGYEGFLWTTHAGRRGKTVDFQAENLVRVFNNQTPLPKESLNVHMRWNDPDRMIKNHYTSNDFLNTLDQRGLAGETDAKSGKPVNPVPDYFFSDLPEDRKRFHGFSSDPSNSHKKERNYEFVYALMKQKAHQIIANEFNWKKKERDLFSKDEHEVEDMEVILYRKKITQIINSALVEYHFQNIETGKWAKTKRSERPLKTGKNDYTREKESLKRIKEYLINLEKKSEIMQWYKDNIEEFVEKRGVRYRFNWDEEAEDLLLELVENSEKKGKKKWEEVTEELKKNYTNEIFTLAAVERKYYDIIKRERKEEKEPEDEDEEEEKIEYVEEYIQEIEVEELEKEYIFKEEEDEDEEEEGEEKYVWEEAEEEDGEEYINDEPEGVNEEMEAVEKVEKEWRLFVEECEKKLEELMESEFKKKMEKVEQKLLILMNELEQMCEEQKVSIANQQVLLVATHIRDYINNNLKYSWKELTLAMLKLNDVYLPWMEYIVQKSPKIGPNFLENNAAASGLLFVKGIHRVWRCQFIVHYDPELVLRRIKQQPFIKGADLYASFRQKYPAWDFGEKFIKIFRSKVQSLEYQQWDPIIVIQKIEKEEYGGLDILRKAYEEQEARRKKMITLHK